MEKDYKTLWEQLRKYIEEICSADSSSFDISKAFFYGVLETSLKSVLKQMDKIENGFAKCDRCGNNIDLEYSTLCQKCYNEQQNQDNIFKDLDKDLKW